MTCNGCLLPIANNEGVTFFLLVNGKMVEHSYHNRFEEDCIGHKLTELHHAYPAQIASAQPDGA